MDEFTYEVISQAMLIYQDELGDSDSKVLSPIRLPLSGSFFS